MGVAIVLFPPLVHDATQATISYILSICEGSRFVQELLTWLVEERNQRHREYTNSSKSVIQYEIGDMVLGGFKCRRHRHQVVC